MRFRFSLYSESASPMQPYSDCSIDKFSHLTFCFVFASPCRTWPVLYNRILPSLFSREGLPRVLQPKRPSLPPGQTTLLTSALTSWGLACRPPRPASPASTPSNKVREAIDLTCKASPWPGSPTKCDCKM